MIKVTYENTDNGQKCFFNLSPAGKYDVNINVEFEPELKDGVKDPYGIMDKLFKTFITQED